MKTEKNWASGSLKEVPFWRDDMSVEEYEVERTYLIENWDKVENGTYVPLWKQAKKYQQFAKALYNGKRPPCPQCGKEQNSSEKEIKHIFYFRCEHCGFTININ